MCVKAENSMVTFSITNNQEQEKVQAFMKKKKNSADSIKTSADEDENKINKQEHFYTIGHHPMVLHYSLTQR